MSGYLQYSNYGDDEPIKPSTVVQPKRTLRTNQRTLRSKQSLQQYPQQGPPSQPGQQQSQQPQVQVQGQMNQNQNQNKQHKYVKSSFKKSTTLKPAQATLNRMQMQMQIPMITAMHTCSNSFKPNPFQTATVLLQQMAQI